jgi:WD40 repeat protein
MTESRKFRWPFWVSIAGSLLLVTFVVAWCVLPGQPHVIGFPLLRHVKVSGRWPRGFALAPDGNALAYVSFDSERNAVPGTTTVNIVDLSETHNVRRLMAIEEDFVKRLAWSPDGQLLALTTERGLVEVWDVKHWSRVWSKNTRQRGWDLLFSESRLITCAGPNAEPGVGGMLMVWNSRTGEQLWTLDDFRDAPVIIAAAPNSPQVVVGCDYGGLIKFVDLDRREVLAESGWREGVTGGPKDDGVNDLHISDDGKLLAVCGRGGITIWSIVSREKLLEHRDPESYFGAIRFLPHGKGLLTRDGDGLKTWKIQPERLQLVRNDPVKPAKSRFVTVTDGLQIVFATPSGIAFYELPP